jgi:DNA-binding LacI/PurR family transcriptional regulator
MAIKRTKNPPKTLPPRRVRMIDIARAAGVSQPAVSYVLSGTDGGRVSLKTADKIRRIAKQLNFHPNHAARQLLGKRTGVIGALANTWFYFPLRPRFLAFLNQYADQHDLKILTWQTGNRTEPIEQFIGESAARGIDGLVYLAFDNDPEWPVAAPLLAQLPHVVSVLGDPGIAGGGTVLCDVAAGVRQAVEHLHRQGRRKIVQIVDSLEMSMNRCRQDAFRQISAELGRAADADQLCVATRHWSGDDDAKFAELAHDLVRIRGADAILADSDMGAATLIRALGAMGLRVPQDVAVIGWGMETISRYVTPALTTVDYRLPEVLDATLDMLTAMIEERDVPTSVTIRPDLVVRASA